MSENYVSTPYSMKEEPVKVQDSAQKVETWHEDEHHEWTEPTSEAELLEPEAPEDEVSVPEFHDEAASTPVVPPTVVTTVPVAWLKSEEIQDLKTRWNTIQIDFVDEPRKSVEQADALVVEALKHIEQAFTDQRATLNERWLNLEDIQTEDLRVSLQSYRSFLNRILAL